MKMLRRKTGLRYALMPLILTLWIALLGVREGQAQGSASVVATGLSSPIGLAVDAEGNVWVAEQGTGAGDGRIAIITPDGTVHPFLVGLPSEITVQDEVSGPSHLYFDAEGKLWIVQGEGSDPLSASLLVIDPAGFTPGNTPLNTDAIDEVINIGFFSLSRGAAETNPYTMAFGDNGDIYVVDAAANMVVRRDGQTGLLHVHARFAPIPNPTPVGPPFSDPVPTGSVFADGKLYVSTLVGFPFPEGAAQVFEIDSDGTMTVFEEGLTSLVELDVDPRDGSLTALQFARFDLAQGGFVPGTGGVFKLHEGRADPVAAGLNLSSGMRYAPDGTLYVSSLFGQVLKVTSTAGPGQVYASGLSAPIGIEMDARGWLWVMEQGTGNDDGRISVVTPDGTVHPFMTGLRSVIVEGSPESAQHLTFHDGELWAAYGLGSETPESYILHVDTTGFTPGGDPLTVQDATVIDIGTFVLGAGFPQTSVYDLAFDAKDNLYLVDASANAIIRRDGATGALSVFARFDAFPNPTPVGPPFIQAVPTNIVFAGDRFYVSRLSGFPFLDGMAVVYEISLDGTLSVLQGGLTLLVDLAVHPSNGTLFALQIGQFSFQPFPHFETHSGQVVALRGGGAIPQAEALNFASGMAFGDDGRLYVSSVADGEVRVLPAALVTANEAGPEAEVPQAFTLSPNYPNPFNPATTIRYTLAAPAHVALTVFDVLGREVARLVDGPQAAGPHAVVWEASRLQGLASGVYLYRLEAAGQSQVRTMLLVK